MEEKKYIVVVQCHIVKERCSGYFCERAFTHRTGRFSDYPNEQNVRFLPITCGGCCGRAVHRKISDLLKYVKKKEKIDKDEIVVHLSSCITKDNYHGPPCPHKDYLGTMITEKLGLDLREDTTLSKTAQKRREEGQYKV